MLMFVPNEIGFIARPYLADKKFGEFALVGFGFHWPFGVHHLCPRCRLSFC